MVSNFPMVNNVQHAVDWTSIHNIMKPTLEPLVRTKHKDDYGALVGYLTAAPASIKL